MPYSTSIQPRMALIRSSSAYSSMRTPSGAAIVDASRMRQVAFQSMLRQEEMAILPLRMMPINATSGVAVLGLIINSSSGMATMAEPNPKVVWVMAARKRESWMSMIVLVGGI